MLIIVFFAFFWLRSYLEYTMKFIVSASCATYYWTCDFEDDGEAEVCFAMRLAHVNHAGSIAMGSFCIGFVQTLNFIFMYWARKAQNLTPKNACIKLCVCCANCCIYMLENFVDHISINAFAYMVNTGENFCSSAYNGFLLNIKHGINFQMALQFATATISLLKWTVIGLNIIVF